MEKKRTQTFVEFCGEIIEENKYKWKRRKQDEEFKRKNEEESLDKFEIERKEREERLQIPCKLQRKGGNDRRRRGRIKEENYCYDPRENRKEK